MIIPWILFARMRARNKGRKAKLASLITVTVTVCCLTLTIPTTITAQSNESAGFGTSLRQGPEMHWGFSHSNDELSNRDLSYPGSYTSSEGPGYWFKSMPWLGFASEETLFPKDVGGVNYGTDEDINTYPLTGLLMFRYPMGRFQPYLGIGPTLFSSGDGLQQMDILDRVFLGFSYTF